MYHTPNPHFPSTAFPAQTNGFARDMTAADLSSHMAPVAGSGTLNIMFFYHRVHIENAADSSVNGTQDVRLCVAKHPRGDRLTTSVRYISERDAQMQFPNEWAAFKNTNDSMPMQGTPLHELPGVTASQIGLMMVHGFRCVEDVASHPAEMMTGMGMDALSFRELAVKWIEAKTAGEGLRADAQAQASAAARIAQLEQRLALAEAEAAENRAKVDLIQSLGLGAASAPAQMVGFAGIVPAQPVHMASVEPEDFSVADDPLAYAEGGMATGNDDLGDDDPLGDPLGLSAPAKRGRK